MVVRQSYFDIYGVSTSAPTLTADDTKPSLVIFTLCTYSLYMIFFLEVVTKYLNISGEMRVVNKAITTSEVKIAGVIIPAVKAKVAIPNSTSPFGVKPQPIIIPSRKVPLFNSTAIVVPPTVPNKAIMIKITTKKTLAPMVLISVFNPTHTKNKGIKNPKATIWIDFAISCSSQ